MSSINSRVIPEFIGVLYCFICCKVGSPTSLNCYSFDKQLSGSLQFPEGNTDSPLNCFDFGTPDGAAAWSSFSNSSFSPGSIQPDQLLQSCAKKWLACPEFKTKSFFFFSLLHLGGILRIRNLKIQNIGALMKFGDYLLK